MTTLQITDLPLDNVRPHPQNVRRELRGLDELADSIKAEGLHQPVVVAPDGDQYVVVMGNSRRAACEQLGWDTIPCIVRADLATEEKVLSAMLAENCARNDLTITEEGDAFQRLLDLDLSPAAVGKRAGRSRKQVTDRVAIAAQPEKVRQAVDDRQISLANALTLAELEDDHQLYARVEATIGTPRFDYEVKRALALRANIKAEQDMRAELTTAGYVEAADDEPAEGFRIERLFRHEPDGPDESLRFRIWNPSPEHQAPHVQWHRIVPVEPEPTEQAAEDVTPATSEVDAWAAERTAEHDALTAAREAAAQERKTAANRRRAHLKQLWKEFAEEKTPDSGLASLLRHTMAESPGGSFMESPGELVVVIDPDASELDEDDPRLDPHTWSEPQLQFALWWCLWAVGFELEVSNFDPNVWEEGTGTYLEQLRDVLDYELSDIEEALLDTFHDMINGDGTD